MIEPLANLPRPLGEDPWLEPFAADLRRRHERTEAMARRLTADAPSLQDFASGHEFFGLHRDGRGWVFREWAPNARAVHLVGDFTDWQCTDRHALTRGAGGVWEIRLPGEALRHGQLYRLRIAWSGGEGDRLPAYARRVVQDEETLIFNAQVWCPETPYTWRNPRPATPSVPLLVYESHIGMAQDYEGIGTFDEFRRLRLARIAEEGYNTLQLMAILEHPYYGSFGYHVSSFFAVSSRFGTPDELKALVDEAHGLGLRVVIDLVHSHAARNTTEGIALFDGTPYQYFHEGDRGYHEAWDSCCFDYGKPEVLHFLLSNCRFWLDEYRIDGFRFDGVTSMIYRDHGLSRVFTRYEDYFDEGVDEDALTYLALANRVIHAVCPDAVTVAEDVSGMPGLGAPAEEGGCGFDFRLAMGVTDMWFRLLDKRDEEWSMSGLWHELTNRRRDEKSIGYVECHDQAIVGGQTLIFRLLGARIYDAMHAGSESLTVERGMALHKMARLVTAASSGHGYLTFMGNEFGHPEWIDFPREGNDWSYHHACRRWNLRDDLGLRFHFLARFERRFLELLKGAEAFAAPPQFLACNDDRKLLAFERNGLFFFFNFHWDASYPDCEFECLPGQYETVLDSDAVEFGGRGRLDPTTRHRTLARTENATLRHRLSVYLPARTALVLRRCAP